MNSIRLPSLAVLITATAAMVSAVTAAPLQICTSQTIQGFPVSGDVCGGSTHALQCTAGALYSCQAGKRFEQNNCTLRQACSIGCQTRPTNGSFADTCFSGTPPFALSSTNMIGGNDLTLTATLAASHPNGAYLNLNVNRSDLVPGSYCAVPNLAAGVTSVSFGMSTAVVSLPLAVNLSVNIGWSDAAGVSWQLVSVPSVLTLQPGGTEPPAPPLASFTLSPSTIAPGGMSVMDVVLARMAPARGIPISVSSSNPSVASVVTAGQPFVGGSCTTGGGAVTIQAANSVAQTTTVTISASSGAPGQAPLTKPLTVTGGCTPASCFTPARGASCDPIPDGCGGTISCGCSFGETCGGGGTPGVCGTPPTLTVSSLVMSPSTVTGGSASTGTVTLSMTSPPGGAAAFLSSSSAVVTVPSSVVVPEGQTQASFTATTSTVSTSTVATISASLSGTATATLTVNPTASCTPTTCAAQGKNCGTISNGCGGTLSCGSCAAPQTCGGGGVPNVCGGGTSTAVLTLTATGRSGESISSSPAGLQVSVGTTGSASFATGTLVTLTVSNGRDAIWSGGCSSGGAKTKSCSLTLNAATSVTANVQ